MTNTSQARMASPTVAEDTPAYHARVTGQVINGWFGARYILALIGIWIAVYTPASATLSIRVGQIDPEGKAASLALVASVGAAVALLSNPLLGALSDRSTSRFGQRKPFIIGGVVGGCAAVFGVGLAPNIAFVTIAWALAQLAFNAALAATIAILPERIPTTLRGKVSGYMGMTAQVGVVGGMYLVQLVGTDGPWMFVAPAAIGIGLVLPFALNLREVPRTREQVGRIDLRVIAGSFWINPVKNRNFALAWMGRFFVWTALYLLTTYKTYYLIDRLGYSTQTVVPVLTLILLVLAAAIAVSSIPAGWLSDRVGRRKIFVVIASLFFVAAMLVVAFGTTVTHFIIGIIIAGLGTGLYMGVDYALVAEVLPNQSKEAAKGMGVFNLTTAIPQTIAPVIAPSLLAIGTGGGNYTAMYLAAAGFALVGAVITQLIRGIK